jgi:eukaryotic-like serine/threonine-protein kinase
MRAQELFLIAIKLEPDQREAFLDQTCGDMALRQEAASLIKAYEQAGNFLENSPVEYVAIEKFSESPDAPTKPLDSLIGRTLGEFVVKKRLGEGGFGAVYLAEQLTLVREVIIKVLHARHRLDKHLIERFKREAYLASRLEHPYTAHVYAFGAESDGLLWIAMELVNGTPLNRFLETQRQMPLERFVPLLDKICEVVHTAHEFGIVHRDLKPANVMLISRAGRYLPKLLDFGIAKGFNIIRPAQQEQLIP